MFDKLKSIIPSEDNKIVSQYKKLLAKEDFANSKKLIEEAYASNPKSESIAYFYIARLINDRDEKTLDKLIKKDKELVKNVLAGYLENLNAIILNKQFLPTDDIIFRASLVERLYPKDCGSMALFILGNAGNQHSNNRWESVVRICKFGLDFVKKHNLEKDKPIIQSDVIHTFHFFLGDAYYGLKKYSKAKKYLEMALKETKKPGLLNETQSLLIQVERHL